MSLSAEMATSLVGHEVILALGFCIGLDRWVPRKWLLRQRCAAGIAGGLFSLPPVPP